MIIEENRSEKFKNDSGEMNPRLPDYIVSCYFWITLFLISGILFPFALLIWSFTVLFDKRRILLHKLTCTWSDIVLSVNPYWTSTIEGRKKIDRRKTYIMVSNHSSGADILLLFRLHRNYKWVAKKSLFFIPFIGWNMWLSGYIPIMRTRGRSKLRMMDKAANAVHEGNSVIIFPEGTRTQNGKLQSFRTGAFRLALDTKTSILPIAINGTFHAIRKSSLLIHKNHHIRLEVLDPIPYESIALLEPKEIAIMVHDLIAAKIRS